MPSVFALALAWIVPGILLPGPAASPVPGPRPYSAPPFAAQCHWHRYGDGVAPPLSLIGQEPLCVEYSKRDITATNGGAIRFALAEPARFVIAVPACEYWQRDHWRFRISPGERPYVTWDGSYWFDKRRGEAGARLASFTVAGRPAGIGDAVAALRPLSPGLAAALAAYGTRPGESGMTAALPGGLACQS
ncbi:MAG: hypothetical protein ACM32E_23425 [Gemmatimonadota bacterium]